MYRINLDEESRQELIRRTHQSGIKSQVRDRLEMVRLCAAQWNIPQIARHLNAHQQTVRYWIKAYLAGGFDALADKPHTGRQSTITPEILATFEALLTDEAAGDPMSQQKWTRNSAAHLSDRLKEQGITLSRTTVSKLLRRLGYSTKNNLKKKKAKTNDPKVSEQFAYIASQKRRFLEDTLPVLSIDVKKKELIGNFMRKGKIWRKEVEEVNYYDFTSLAVCRAVPYGIYDVGKNQGYVYVGTSGDTAEFAVLVIARWWKEEGSVLYPGLNKLLLLADGGGSNGYRSRAWKMQLQTELCDKLGLTVTVCHYPTGCSKWNHVERLLFSQISINWAGKPLTSLELMLGYIRGTHTKTGMTVKVFLQEGIFKTGQKVTKKELDQLSLQPHEVCSDWNYTLSPRSQN